MIKCLIIFLFSFFFTLTLVLSFHVIVLDPRNRMNRVFFFNLVMLDIQFFVPILTQLADNTDQLDIIIKVASVLLFVLFGAILLSCLAVTERAKPGPLAIFLIFSPLIPASYVMVTLPYMGIYERVNEVWYITGISNDFLFILICMLSNIIYLTASFVVLFTGILKAISARKKRQFILLFVSLVSSCGPAFFHFAVLFFLLKIDHHKIPGIELIYHFIWIIGLFIAVTRYRFLSISPERVSRDILENVDEAVVLIDTGGRIIAINKKTESLLHQNRKELEGKAVGSIFQEEIEVNKMLAAAPGQDRPDDFRIFNLSDGSGLRVPVESKFVAIKDRFGDEIGVLAISREIKGLGYLKEKFRITEREIDLIKLLLYGKENKDIAEELSISVNTVKNHIASIYCKLGIESRIGLIKLLRDYKLIG